MYLRTSFLSIETPSTEFLKILTQINSPLLLLLPPSPEYICLSCWWIMAHLLKKLGKIPDGDNWKVVLLYLNFDSKICFPSNRSLILSLWRPLTSMKWLGRYAPNTALYKVENYTTEKPYLHEYQDRRTQWGYQQYTIGQLMRSFSLQHLHKNTLKCTNFGIVNSASASTYPRDLVGFLILSALPLDCMYPNIDKILQLYIIVWHSLCHNWPYSLHPWRG